MPDQLLLRLTAKIWQWVVDESGQDLMEYGLLVVLASLIAISLQQQLAQSLLSMFSKISNTVT
jgi:Flp pilus assembly pilin Flp